MSGREQETSLTREVLAAGEAACAWREEATAPRAAEKEIYAVERLKIFEDKNHSIADILSLIHI